MKGSVEILHRKGVGHIIVHADITSPVEADWLVRAVRVFESILAEDHDWQSSPRIEDAYEAVFAHQ